MKPFQDRHNLDLTRTLVEVSALVMRRVRAEVRQRPTGGLTYTEIRALSAVIQGHGRSVTEAAEFLGLGVPTTSKVITELVERGLVERKECADDRRRVELDGTKEGRQVLSEAAEPANQVIAGLLAPLTAEERELIGRSLALLHPLVLAADRCKTAEEEDV
jgi:DNA-binding MarR family transcriptional regulator